MTLYLIGDSTLQYNSILTYPQMGWGQMLHLYLLPQFQVKNHAKNGRSSKSFLDEGLFEPVKEALQKEDLLLIQFGHNDEKDDPKRHTEAYGSYQSHLKYYIDCARAVGAVPILISPLARRKFSNGKADPKNHLDYPDAMKALAKETNTHYIPLYEKSLALIDQWGQVDSAKLFLHYPKGMYPAFKDGIADDTHLSVEGAVTFAGLIAEGLKDLGYAICIE